MKLIHTSDWHIGRKFSQWERTHEHRYFFERLTSLIVAERPDLLVVSGDIYDVAIPPIEAQMLFVDTLCNLVDAHPTMHIVVTSGNHDSGLRLGIHSRLWADKRVHIVGPSVRTADDTDPQMLDRYILHFPGVGIVAAVPFFNASFYPSLADNPVERPQRRQAFFDALMARVAQHNTSSLPVVMMAHMALAGCNLRGHDMRVVGGEEMCALDSVGSGYDYLALGHIHMPQWLDKGHRSVRYSGSPFAMTFDEDYDHGVTIVEIDHHGAEPRVREVTIEPLHRVVSVPDRAGTFDEASQALASAHIAAGSYVRVLLDATSPMPLDCDAQLARIADQRDLRLATVQYVQPDTDPSKQGPRLTIDQVKTMTPLDVARQHYMSRKGVEMPQHLLSLLQEVCDAIDNPNNPTL